MKKKKNLSRFWVISKTTPYAWHIAPVLELLFFIFISRIRRKTNTLANTYYALQLYSNSGPYWYVYLWVVFFSLFSVSRGIVVGFKPSGFGYAQFVFTSKYRHGKCHCITPLYYTYVLMELWCNGVYAMGLWQNAKKYRQCVSHNAPDSKWLISLLYKHVWLELKYSLYSVIMLHCCRNNI